MIIDKSQTPIFITGVERSGAPIIAKIIEACDVFIGEISKVCENIEIKKIVDKCYEDMGIPINPMFRTVEYESSSKASLNSQFPLPDTNQILIPKNWKNKIEGVLNSGGIKKNQIWMYKSSRICQTWPIWNYAFPNAKWIIVRRRTGDIINSCLKTTYMNAFKDITTQKLIGVENESEGWKWWIHEHERLFCEMITEGLDCKQIWPDRMVCGDYYQIYEMLEWLGLRLSHGKSIEEIAKPLLFHEQKERSL